MMRVSVIAHPPRSRFVALRPHYVEMCDGNVCAAMLLSVFEGWKNWHRQGHDYQDPAADLALRLSMNDLQRDLCGGYGKDAIKSGLTVLIDKGFIEEAVDEPKGTDRAKRWHFVVPRVQEAVNAIGGDPQMVSDQPQIQEREPATLAGAGDTAEKNEGKEPTDVEVIWSYYVQVFKASRQTLDDKRRTIIRNALKVRSVEECKRAIDGLSVSPFHNGDNEQRKKYLGIRYALSGIGKQSNDERIDNMVDIADAHGGVVRGGKLPSDHPRIQRWLANVRTSLRSQTEMTRGRESLLSLRENGYDVMKLDAPPWVKLVAANEQQAA